MVQAAAAINQTIGSSKKCPQCGIRNFADTKECKRCKSDLSLPLVVAKNDKQTRVSSVEVERSRLNFVWVLAALVVVLSGLVLFFMRQGSPGTPAAPANAVVAQDSVALDGEEPAQSVVEQNSQSEAAAAQIVTDLKRFQDATEHKMDFDEYEKKLNNLKTAMNDTLPSFVRQEPSDEIFRQEVAGALRDYTAAGNWWKTTIRNSTVFTEVDRDERTHPNFDSARTHIANAQKALVR